MNEHDSCNVLREHSLLRPRKWPHDHHPLRICIIGREWLRSWQGDRRERSPERKQEFLEAAVELAGVPHTWYQHSWPPGSQQGQGQGKERVGHGGASARGQTGLYQEPERSHGSRLTLTGAPRHPNYDNPYCRRKTKPRDASYLHKSPTGGLGLTSGASGVVTSVPAPGPPTSLVWGTLPESKPRSSQFSPTVLSRAGTSEVPVLYPSHKN